VIAVVTGLVSVAAAFIGADLKVVVGFGFLSLTLATLAGKA
jgi:hypothetical protein